VRKIILTLSIILAGLSLASALTLDEAKELALSKNPTYQAQLNSFKAAQWSSQGAFSNLLPSLSLTGTYVYLDPATQIRSGNETLTMNHDLRSYSLNLSQPLFMGGKLWQAYKITKDGEEISRLALENTKLSVLNGVESRYLNVLQLQELLAISVKDLQSSKQNLEIAQVRFSSGTISQPELLRIKSKAAAKEVTLIQSQTALELAKQDLMNYLSLGEGPELQPVSLNQETDWLAALQNWNAEQVENFSLQAVRLAKANNLTLQTAQKSHSIAKRSYSIAKGSFLPMVALALSRSYDENGFDRYKFEGSNTLALTASLPLLPFLDNYSASRQAYYEVQKSSYDLTNADNNISLGVRSAALNLVSAARQINASQTALDYTQQTYDQLMERYRSNLLSTTDMLDAEVMLQAAETGLTNSRYGYLKAKSALLQVLGTSDPNVINNLMIN
jgi:outer membrane protein